MEEKTFECGCGCGEDLEERDVIYLTLDDDTVLECDVLEVFQVEGKDYIALLSKEDETVLLYEFYGDGEDIRLENIEDDDAFQKVSEAFDELTEDWEE